MNFSDHGKRIYSAQNLPADCIWGSESAFGNLSKILCQKDTAQPISIWVVGEVASAWMFQRNGDPADRAAINFVPLSPEMRQICATQLRELSVPVASVAASNWGPEQVRAYTWMNKGAPIKGTGGIAPPPPEFTEFYDATTKLQDKVVMNKLPITDLKEHDLVLVEAAVQRYAVHDQGRQPARGYRRSLDKWAAYYDLQAVYLLNKAVGSSRRSNAPTLGLSI
ncbi:hypothetical protein DFH09DRAFT_559161 [Mycena vulgaris]|nr:hypothetical protein DFH09DRAFT_559161 [Mycena vulgaris]